MSTIAKTSWGDPSDTPDERRHKWKVLFIGTSVFLFGLAAAIFFS